MGSITADSFKNAWDGVTNESWDVCPYECTQHTDDTDSGIHVMMNAESFLHGQHPGALHSKKSVKSYRRYISQCLITAAIDHGTIID